MSYRFTESALKSLMQFDQSDADEIQDVIEDAAEQDFYNHDSYSYVYDKHGNPWDKLDLKTEGLNHRVFFTKVDSTFYVLEIFDRDELEYARELYKLLKRLGSKIEE